MSSSSSSPSTKQVVVDPFCFRQFSEHPESSSYKGTVFYDLTVSQMEDIVNQYYDPKLLQDGYAPFCKHLFLKNDNITTSARSNVLEITPHNQHLLRSEYQARNDQELPVLIRFFPSDLLREQNIELSVATYLDFILYSREQIQQENSARGQSDNNDNPTLAAAAPWSIVSIKAQTVNYELPMTPITAMRNALGKEHGGSGVPLDRLEYLKAVEYWKNHAIVS